MLKPRHLLHPFRTASAVKALVETNWNVKRLVSRGERRFINDVRYDLQNVTDGLVSRLRDKSEDTALLERICTAYISATEQQSFVEPVYRATSWWHSMRQGTSARVQRALATRDTNTLRTIFQNFFRDPCSAGLIGVPLHTAKIYSGKAINDLYRRFILLDALHRIDYWKAQTGHRYKLRDLEGPGVGNPYGVVIEGTFVSVGAEYQHYCAQRIGGLLPSPRASVVEIGGGFGSMAYYLLRDRPGVMYIDFDVPESLALSSYYLLKSFPNCRFLLYGEEDLTSLSHATFDIILMPVFELRKLPTRTADLVFSSHAMSCLSPDAMVAYMKDIARFTRGFFLYVGEGAGGVALQKLIRTRCGSLTLKERHVLKWNTQKFIEAEEMECLYQIGATGVASA
jgi:putative sugar O-methyltransferase